MSAWLVHGLEFDGIPVALADGPGDSSRRVRATKAPRVHAELRLGLGIASGRKRVARLMRVAGLAGVSYRRNAADSGRSPRRTSASFGGSSQPRAQTGCGAPASRSTRPAPGGSIAPRSWTDSPADRRVVDSRPDALRAGRRCPVGRDLGAPTPFGADVHGDSGSQHAQLACRRHVHTAGALSPFHADLDVETQVFLSSSNYLRGRRSATGTRSRARHRNATMAVRADQL